MHVLVLYSRLVIIDDGRLANTISVAIHILPAEYYKGNVKLYWSYLMCTHVIFYYELEFVDLGFNQTTVVVQ